jgi:hypothetical protein
MKDEWQRMPTTAKLLCVAVAIILALSIYDTAFIYDLNQYLGFLHG